MKMSKYYKHCFLLLLPVVFTFSSCSTGYTISTSKVEEISIADGENTLSGSLLLPKGEEPFPTILFIHGDGPQDRFANEGYAVLINNFLENGIAVFSWDKPGVGKSTGNWLHQSMKMRAEEAITVMRHIKNRKEVKNNSVGFIGFSQAGWVLPEMAKMTNDMAYMILVGGAINWMEQKGCFENNQQEILKIIPAEPISTDRALFINLNKTADAKEGIAQIKTPFLGVFGEDDLNVNSANSIKVYRQIFKETAHQDYEITMVPKATHVLLNSDKYNYIGAWPLKAKLRYLVEGKKAYAPGYLELLTTWIQNH